MHDGVKLCSKCGEEYGLGSFSYSKTRGAYDSWCKLCHRDYGKERRRKCRAKNRPSGRQ